MDKTDAPKCCKKPMELKGITSGNIADVYFFQCKKCGKIGFMEVQ